MAVTRVCYCTSEDVALALDIQLTSRSFRAIEDAIQSSAEAVEGLCNRRFYPEDRKIFIDWPGYDGSPPWRQWLNASEIADITVNVPVVTSGGNVIPAGQVLWGPWREPGPPYRWFELDRSTNAAFGTGPTPQRDISVAGTFGYWLKTEPAGALAAPVTDTTGTTITVTGSSAAGVGDLVTIGSERMLVQAKIMMNTAVAYSGLSTASAADNILAVPDGTQFAPGDVLQLDAERLYVISVAGNNLETKRAWDGTILAPHTSGTVYAARQWKVARGQLGTVAATHLSAAPAVRHVYPGLVHELSIAESVNSVLQKSSGYSRTVGEGQTLQPISGAGLADVRARCRTQFGRSARHRVI